MRFYIFCLFSFSIANSVEEPKAVQSNDALNLQKVVYISAVDFSDIASQQQLNSLKKANYSVVLVRGFRPDGTGYFDTNSIRTINNAIAVGGIVTEVYITPQPKSYKTGAKQVIETFYGLTNNGIGKEYITRLWLQVFDLNAWGTLTIGEGVTFIQSAVTQIQQLGLTAGICTSSNDWWYITGGNTNFRTLPLWYNSTNGAGPYGESPANFDDFLPFGGWTNPAVKQYGQGEMFSYLNINRDVVDFNAMPVNSKK